MEEVKKGDRERKEGEKETVEVSGRGGTPPDGRQEGDSCTE